MIHGLLEQDAVRERLLESLWKRRGRSRPAPVRSVPRADAEYDRLEAHVREHVDLRLLRELARIG
jgi:cobyric acid synthase